MDCRFLIISFCVVNFGYVFGCLSIDSSSGNRYYRYWVGLNWKVSFFTAVSGCIIL